MRGCGFRRPPRWPPIKRSPPRRWRRRRKPTPAPQILKSDASSQDSANVDHDPTIDNPLDDFIAKILKNFGINWDPAQGTVNGLPYDAYTNAGQPIFWVVRALELLEDFQQFGYYLVHDPALAFQYLVQLALFDWPTHILEIVSWLSTQPELLVPALLVVAAPFAAVGGFAGLAGLVAIPHPAVVPAPAPVPPPSPLPVVGMAPTTVAPAAAPASAPAPAPAPTATTVASLAPPPSPPRRRGGFRAALLARASRHRIWLGDERQRQLQRQKESAGTGYRRGGGGRGRARGGAGAPAQARDPARLRRRVCGHECRRRPGLGDAGRRGADGGLGSGCRKCSGLPARRARSRPPGRRA